MFPSPQNEIIEPLELSTKQLKDMTSALEYLARQKY